MGKLSSLTSGMKIHEIYIGTDLSLKLRISHQIHFSRDLTSKRAGESLLLFRRWEMMTLLTWRLYNTLVLSLIIYQTSYHLTFTMLPKHCSIIAVLLYRPGPKPNAASFFSMLSCNFWIWSLSCSMIDDYSTLWGAKQKHLNTRMKCAI